MTAKPQLNILILALNVIKVNLTTYTVNNCNIHHYNNTSPKTKDLT